ncbi:transglutaminase-like cysteine peptidase [Rhizobium sp. G187]|uniref:transglutaminase-like cysteine peptidase n=1 Tax=Rhizobium sp. G187 TaxID=3451352 RepID=UPI003EE5E200
MKRHFIAAALSLAAMLVSHQSFAGSFLPQTRSIAAPKGFASACSRYDFLCGTRSVKALPNNEAMALLRKVNSSVNSHVRPMHDRAGRDHWALPVNNSGDCEDYALAKKKQLIEAGFPANKLAMTVVLDRRGNNHAVLMARLADGDYILDNLSGSVKSWKSTGYTFLARQNFDNKRSWKVILAGPRARTFISG